MFKLVKLEFYRRYDFWLFVFVTVLNYADRINYCLFVCLFVIECFSSCKVLSNYQLKRLDNNSTDLDFFDI